METVLFISDVNEDGTLLPLSLEVLAGAKKTATDLGASLKVGLFGKSIQSAADSIAGCGAEFLGAEGEELAVSRYASDAKAIEEILKDSTASVIFAPATKRIIRALPGSVARLEGRTDTRIQSIELKDGKLVAQRWFYKQRMLGKFQRTQSPWALVFDGGVFEAWQGESSSATIKMLSVELSSATKVIGIESASADADTIRPDADLLFVAGAGWTKKQGDGEFHVKDAESTILDFLAKSEASLGSSKSLVDQQGEGGDTFQFMSHLNQVGQTGATPRHSKGLATCCHGEEPHVVGWRFIGERRAVNLDAGCGWAQGKTDVLYVGDAFEVMKEVNSLLNK